jgi:acyl-CoA reductase-like NAD-dependent aldehyde dehydrogenase
VAPALATGNTAVVKPSEVTSLTGWELTFFHTGVSFNFSYPMWSAFRLAQVIKEVGLPAGVCNFVFGTGANAGAALVQHPDVPLISFTGGTVTGDRLDQHHIKQHTINHAKKPQIASRIRVLTAPLGKKLSLELGGKNPALVFASANLATVVPELVRASFTNQGEICLCASRIYVQQPLYDAFVEHFVVRRVVMARCIPISR